jgi:uncharacterized membrane protein YphA (DoxX/SURF4 family)
VHLVASLLLGAVFVVSGAAKLAIGERWTGQASGLGVPRPIALVVPWIELAVGAMVATQLAEPGPAVAALALLIAFTVVIAWNLRIGRRPPCACFGAWSSAPISWRHVARNVAFVGLAVVVIATT